MEGFGMSPFERAARGQKVMLLVGFIDRSAVDHGVDPLARPDRVLEALTKMNAAGWAKAAAKAHVNPPSDETIAAVRAVYERRLELARRAS
jgi:hypothetical protein